MPKVPAPAQAEEWAPPPIDQPAPLTTQDFESRYQDWGRGSRSEFAVWDFLSNRQHLDEGRDFIFLPAGVRGDISKFYVGSKVWRITGETVLQNQAQVKIDRMRLEASGQRVIDIKTQNLQYPGQEQALGAAWQGREL